LIGTGGADAAGGMQRLSALGHLSMVEKQSLGEACTSNPFEVQAGGRTGQPVRRFDGCRREKLVKTSGPFSKATRSVWRDPASSVALRSPDSVWGEEISASSSRTHPLQAATKKPPGRCPLEPRSSTHLDAPRCRPPTFGMRPDSFAGPGSPHPLAAPLPQSRSRRIAGASPTLSEAEST
jgi:hypothetical protein